VGAGPAGRGITTKPGGKGGGGGGEEEEEEKTFGVTVASALQRPLSHYQMLSYTVSNFRF